MNPWQKVILASVAMLVIGGVLSVFALKGLLTTLEVKSIVGGLMLLLIPSPLQSKAASIFAGHDVNVAELAPDAAPTKPGGVS